MGIFKKILAAIFGAVVLAPIVYSSIWFWVETFAFNAMTPQPEVEQPAVEIPAAEHYALLMACQYSRYDCSDFELPYIFYTRSLWPGYNGVHFGNNVIAIDWVLDPNSDDKAMGVLIHELVHALQAHHLTPTPPNPMYTCLREEEAYAVEFAWYKERGRDDLINLEWNKGYECFQSPDLETRAKLIEQAAAGEIVVLPGMVIVGSDQPAE